MSFKLSILICSLQKRLTQFSLLAEHIEKQATDKPVEILWLGDNKTMSVGEKRNKLVSLARGEYICFVDDDDWVADDYVEQILLGISHKADCICFNAIYTNDKAPLTPPEGGTLLSNSPLPLGGQGWAIPVIFSVHNILNVNEPGKPRIRVPNHLIPIKREYVLATKFLEKSFGEDTDYSLRIRKLLKTEYKIEKALYHYRFSETGSETYKYSPRYLPKAPPQPSPIGRGSDNSKVLPKGKDLGWASRPVIMDVVIVSNAELPPSEGFREATQQCINSIAADNVNVIVIEKATDIKYANADTFLQKQPFNYNQCLNDGAMIGNAEFICFSNNDVVFPEGFVERVMASLNPPEGGTYDVLSVLNQHGFIHPGIISGFCFVMRRSAFNKMGRLNTNYKFWCADNVTTEQIKQHSLREIRSDIRVFHGTSVTLNRLDTSTREEFTKNCVKQFNKDYNQNVLGMGK
jgi:hypothetical protein